MQLTLDDYIIQSNPWNYMRQMFTPAPLMLTEDTAKTARILSFEARKQARIDGLSAAADRRRTEANRRLDAGMSKLDVIPLGQPIHGVRDRNYRDKARKQIDRGYQIMKEAAAFEDRAKAAAKNKSISSDDPLAIEKLTAKLDAAKRLQEDMKTANAYWRKHGTLDGCPVKAHWNCDGKPFPAWCLSNNNAEIRRIEGRIKEIQDRQNAPERSWAGDGWTAEEDLDDNRIRIYFDGKPEESTRAILKRYGFRWSPRAGAWQRQITRDARWAMGKIAEELK